MTESVEGQASRLFHIKGRVLRAKHRDGETTVVVDIADLLALFSERDRALRARRKYRWLYQRQRGHLRGLIEHLAGFERIADQDVIEGYIPTDRVLYRSAEPATWEAVDV